MDYNMRLRKSIVDNLENTICVGWFNGKKIYLFFEFGNMRV